MINQQNLALNPEHKPIIAAIERAVDELALSASGGVFRLVGKLKDSGKPVSFVSVHLNEVVELARKFAGELIPAADAADAKIMQACEPEKTNP